MANFSNLELLSKDELIRVRTAAVTLMSADLSAKGKSTLDQLEDTRVEMRKMQANFAEQESQWREQNSCLKVELENKDKKIMTIEDSLGRMEKVCFSIFNTNKPQKHFEPPSASQVFKARK